MQFGIPKRFSLRVFLLASVLAGSFLGILLPEMHREMHRRVLISRIEQLGGVVQYDASIPGYWKSKKVTKVTNPPLGYQLEASDLAAFPHLREIGRDVTSNLGMTGEFVMDVDVYQNILLNSSKDKR